MSLREYKRKRKFDQTPEPKGKHEKSQKGPLRFVVQMHKATRLHFDLRLEIDGVFKSWAIPKGFSLNPQDQRLAVFVEDHPLEYGSFEGIIPKGNYGAGTVMLWDSGTYVERSSKGRLDSQEAMRRGMTKGHLTFVLEGEKLRGEFALVQLKKDADQKAWLLIKKRDEFSSIKRIQSFDDHSVKTGRTLEQISKQAEKAGDIWISKEKRQKTPPAKPKPAVSASMPRKIKPMIAVHSKSPAPVDWIKEPHLHGLRALAEVEGGKVHLYSKSGLSFDKRFEKVKKELEKMDLTAVLDGEVVGNIYYVFDLLYSNGLDLRHRPLKERKQQLHKVLQETTHVKRVGKARSSDPQIAKNPLSVYQSGTSDDWKICAGQSRKAYPEQPTLTHLDKIYFPQDGYTKGDVLHYYENVADFILPYLKDRPESLSRHPGGIDQAGFYQKDMTGHIPRWFKTHRIFSKSSERSIDYPVVQDKRSLLYIANLGCIEIHPWFSRIDHLDHPDFLVIDLDPDDNDFKDVVKVALAFHELLDKIGCRNYCKTSGSTGLHIGIPTAARYDFDEVRQFAESVARVIQKKFPTLTSLERTPSRRRKKIYLDCLQNRRGQTLAAPFCIRPRPGAPVSMPLDWSEVTARLNPEQFNITNALRRVQSKGDPWKAVLGQGVDLVKCSKRLERFLLKA